MRSARSWKRAFDDPIPLPRGRQLVNLEDAGKYITKLPKNEHEAQEWQAASCALFSPVSANTVLSINGCAIEIGKQPALWVS